MFFEAQEWAHQLALNMVYVLVDMTIGQGKAKDEPWHTIKVLILQ